MAVNPKNFPIIQDIFGLFVAIFLQMHMITRLSTIKRRGNNRTASFLLAQHDVITRRSLDYYAISQGEGENGKNKYYTPFITVLFCILSSIIPTLDLSFYMFLTFSALRGFCLPPSHLCYDPQ